MAVVRDVVQAEDATLPILKPFVKHLVAADLIGKDLRLNPLEVLFCVDINPSLIVAVPRFLNPGVSSSLEASDRRLQFWRLQEMEVNQTLPEMCGSRE